MLKVLKVLVPGVLTVLMVLGLSLAAQSPAPQPRDGVITGQVVDAATGKPVGAVLVTIGGAAIPARVGPSAPPGPPRILTGGDGRFVFRDLPAGSFTITASKGGYADGASGRRVIGAPPQPVVLTTAQRTAEAAVRIWKNGVIAGTIVDEAGEPVVGAQLRTARRIFSAGRRRFLPFGASVSTDDRGTYRISNLLPGEYLIAVSPPAVSASLSFFGDVARTGRGSGEMAGLAPAGYPNGIQIGDALVMLGRGGAIPPPPIGGRLQIYPTMFYPSARTPAQATTITLSSGDERIGIDFQLQPVPTARVSGTLVAPAGPAGMTTVRLTPAGVDEVAPEALAPVSFADASGAFAFAAVAPGQYSLRAASRVGPADIARPGAEMYWLDMPLTVAGDDVDGVVATMRPALRITARLEFEGAAPGPAAPVQRPGQFVPAPFSLESDDTMTPASMGGPAGSSGERGFTLAGFAAGRYRVRVQNSPAGWMFKAAMLNGVDVSETPFEFTRDVNDLVLTFTDRWSGVSGVVQGMGGGGAMVLAFTTNLPAWNEQGASPRRLKSTRANARGEFGISSVPPGDYYVVAVAEEQAADWRDPKMLEALARLATQIAIAEGEHKTIDLRLKDVRQ